MPSDQIKVYVTSNGGDRNLMMRYKDPHTGKFVSRSTGTPNRKEALKLAGAWQAELREGRYKPASKITWAEFRQRYEDEAVPSMKPKAASKVSGVFNAVERILRPDRLSSLTAERISYFVKVFRAEERVVERKQQTVDEEGRKGTERVRVTVTVRRQEATIKSTLQTLKAALNWADKMKILNEVPYIENPRQAKGSKMMKGRPITGEEFERMLAAVPKVVKPDQVDLWRTFLRGMWLSGLRLGEGLDLWWDREDRMHVVFLRDDTSDPDSEIVDVMLRVHASQEKGGQDRLLPIAPEFAEMLLAVPEHERTDRVFPIPYAQQNAVSKLGSMIGAAAGVKVNMDQRTGKIQHATIHDLRRSFGERWAEMIMPKQLMELMRHESIETTMKYYVGANAKATSRILREAITKKREGQTARKSDEKPTLLPREFKENSGCPIRFCI